MEWLLAQKIITTRSQKITGRIFKRIGGAEQNGNVKAGTTIIIFEYKVKEAPTPQTFPETGMKETIHPIASTTRSASIKVTRSASTRKDRESFETIGHAEDLPEGSKDISQAGIHLPATGEEPYYLALLGLGILADFVGLVPYKKKHD